MRMASGPAEGFPAAFKIAIDDQGAALDCGSSGQTSRLSANDCGTAIDRDTGPIRKYNFTAVRNRSWVDRALPVSQFCAVPTGALLTFLAMPIDRYPREHSALASEHGCAGNN